MMYQVTIIFDDGGMNRFEMSAIPQVGEEVAMVYDGGKEYLYKITKVRHRAYRCDRNPEYSHESAAVVWGESVDNPDGRTLFPT